MYAPAMPAVVDPESLSVREKFGIESTGVSGVTETFNTLHAFIQAGGLDLDPPVIRPGDYIDLASLQIEAYNGRGEVSEINQDIERVPDKLPYPEYEGKLLRLIVAGVNSFHSKGEYKAPPENDAVPHVVFHFQNVPARYATRELGDYSYEGYAETIARRYLVPVDGADGSGVFLRGLIEAGVPEEILWAPTRYITERGGHGYTDELGYTEDYRERNGIVFAEKAQTIRDKLWLPTYNEVNGAAGATGSYSFGAGSVMSYPNPQYETAENQAKLEYYYEDVNKLVKHGSDNKVSYYWLASPVARDDFYSFFCYFRIQETSEYYPDSVDEDAVGIVPAFCVY
jgi:hypothetical protein